MLGLRLADLPDEALESLAGLVVGAQLRQDSGGLLYGLVHVSREVEGCGRGWKPTVTPLHVRNVATR